MLKKLDEKKKISVLLIILIILLFYSVLYLTVSYSITGSFIMIKLFDSYRPKIIITDVATETDIPSCRSLITGEIRNKGKTNAKNIIIECDKELFPIFKDDYNFKESIIIGDLDPKESRQFHMVANNNCKEVSFTCYHFCDNC